MKSYHDCILKKATKPVWNKPTSTIWKIMEHTLTKPTRLPSGLFTAICSYALLALTK